MISSFVELAQIEVLADQVRAHYLPFIDLQIWFVRR
jgi:hypothetical protein